MTIMKNYLRILLCGGAIACSGLPALANFDITQGTGTHIFSLDSGTTPAGTGNCAASSTECTASIPIDKSGTPLFATGNAGLVTGTGGTFPATQSGAWTVQPGNTANTTAWLVTGTGGVFPASQSGAWNITNISGTVSLPTGAATSSNQSSQITQETATAAALGTTADSVCGTATGTCSLVALQKYNNNALNSAIPAGANVIGYTTPDPCSQAVKINKPISQTTNANLITGTSGKKIYVCSVSLIVGGAENVSFVEGTTGGTCGTSTAAVLGGTMAANGPNLAANGGLTLGNGLGTVMSTATNNNDLCLFQSGSDRNAGNLTYVVQ